MSNADFWVGPSTNVPVVNANGNIFEEVQVAAAGQTLFTLLSFQYTPGSKNIFVFKNGVMLRRAVDYTETSATQVTLTVGAALNDKIEFNAIAINQLIAPVVFNGMPSGGTAGQILQKIDGSDYHASWAAPSSVTTLLDAARVNIASASTVNLSAIAATTRNIQITGSIQIDGFQVTNGQVWIAKFAASLILKNNANIVTQAGQDIKIGPNDSCLIRATADNVVEIIAFSRAGESLVRNSNDFRLSLVTGVPVPIADTILASTLYCTPYKGNKITLYNGISWVTRESAEFSLALAGLVAGRPYDVFCYDNAGTPTLEFLAWASTTARATALVTQDGVLVKSGDATRKYLGSFCTVGVNTTTDSQRQRMVWNYYNRVRRVVFRQETTANWIDNTAAIKQANGSALNQIEVMCGVQEDEIELAVTQLGQHTIAGSQILALIGLNSTVAAIAGSMYTGGLISVAGSFATAHARYAGYSALGFNLYTWLESAAGAATGTVYGLQNSSFSGTVFA